MYPQYGFAATAFARMLGASDENLGDDRHSWAVDDENQCTKNKGRIVRIRRIRVRPVEERRRHRPRVRPRQDADARLPQRELCGAHGAPNAVGEGLFAAFSGKTGKVRFNLGEADFRHAPPATDYFQAYAALEG